MRSGEIEVNDAGGGDIDIVFSPSGLYVSATVSCAEAYALGKLLIDAAEKAQTHLFAAQLVSVANGADERSRNIIMKGM